MILSNKTIKVAQYDWATSQAYYYNKALPVPIPTSIEEFCGISEKDVEKFRKSIKNYEFQKLEEGKSVYFCSHVTYPRETFRQNFPKNPIKRDPEKADVIIVDPNNINSDINDRNYYYVDIVDPTRYTLNYYMGGTGQKQAFITIKEKELKAWNSIFVRTAVNVKDLTKEATKDSLELDESLLNNIKLLLSSKSTQDVEIALNMLTNISYEKSKEEIMWLLYTLDWRRVRPRQNVNVKALMRNIETDFPRSQYLNSALVSIEMGKKYQDTFPEKSKIFYEEVLKKFLKPGEDFEFKIIKK